jgi:GT2 family glycosyltransferase
MHEDRAMSAQRLDFSVIVPTYDRPLQLEACLTALAALRYAGDRFEVIVVDDGSAEPVDTAVALFRNRLNVSVVRQENSGPAAARNRGVEHARGAWLAFTDDDCLPNADWLQNFAYRLEKRANCVVGGRTVNGLTDNLCSAMSQIIVDVVYRYYNVRPEQALFFATNNLAMPQELFRRIGGFDEAFTTSEDRDFCDRCLCSGIRMLYAPECVVYHGHSLSYRSFCKQHFNYGRGAFQFLRGQYQRHSRHSWIKTGFHLSVHNWLLYPFSRVRPHQWAGLAVLLFSWQVMNLAGFIVEAARSMTPGRGVRRKA